MSAQRLQIGKRTLESLSIILNAVPIPDPFKSAVVGIPDAVLKIISILETAKGNLEDAKELVVYIAIVTDHALRPFGSPNASLAAEPPIKEFLQVLQDIQEDIRKIASQKSRWKRFVNYDRDASTLTGLKQKVANAITCIQLETTVAISQKQDDMSKAQSSITGQQDLLREDIKFVIEQQDRVYEGQQRIIRELQLILLLGTGDSGFTLRNPCLDGTRMALLENITHWIEDQSTASRQALCLKGSAGRGKSSVGVSIANQERKSRQLGAEFYFAVGQADRNGGVIAVLARQLALWGKNKLRFQIANAISEDGDVARRGDEAYEKLIQEPLETLVNEPECPPLVLLLDGLDEYDNDLASKLLSVIGKGLGKLPSAVRLIITSRPEPHLIQLYDREPLKSSLDIWSLDSEYQEEVRGDIGKYLKETLPAMVWGWVINPSDWPGEERRNALVRLSQDHWIWVITVARMIADPKYRNPEKQLKDVLASEHETSGRYGRNTGLYSIYSQILDRAFPPGCDPDLLTLLRDVLGTLLVVQVPVNIHTLTSIICHLEPIPDEDTHRIRTAILAYLQAVLVVPGVGEADASRNASPISFVHKSFGDYLTDESRRDSPIFVDTAHSNHKITVCCLTFPGLKRATCDLDPPRLISEISGILGSATDGGIAASKQGKEHEEANSIAKRCILTDVSAGLQYACEQWPKHVSLEPRESSGIRPFLEEFVQTNLLHWVEVLSLVGKTEELSSLIEIVEPWLKVKPSPEPSEPLQSAEPSAEQPLRTPSSAPWSLDMLSTNISRGMQMVITRTPSYPTLLHADKGRHDMATRLESLEQPSSSKVAPILAKVCQPATSHPPITLLQELRCFVHEFMAPISTSSSHIYTSALPFMPAHSPLLEVYGHMAEGGPNVRRGRLQRWSTPGDHGVRVEKATDAIRKWSTEEPIGETLVGHTSGVNCVAWSPDGKAIVSGSEDHTVRVWDASSRTPIGEALKGHTNGVSCVAWSPDGKTIISGSKDRSIRMWDASTREPIGEAFNGHANRVTCVAWSADSKTILSGSWDYTLRSWAASTRSPTKEVQTSPSEAKPICWSPSRDTVVSRTGNNSLHLLAASTGVSTGASLEGHKDTIWDVAWSPDSKTIASVSQDRTVKIWDVTTKECGRKVLAGHTGPIKCVAWSPDGKTIASGSWDMTVRLWDALTQAPIGMPLKGHKHAVYGVAWSPDGRTIVSGSQDNTLRLWDASTGEPIRFGQRWPHSHTHSVYRLAFSPDNQKLVSASTDGTLRLWDVSTGALAQEHLNQARNISSLTFSPDGKFVLAEDEETQTKWNISGEKIELLPATSAEEDKVTVLTINNAGWLRDSLGKRMFWVPVVLRPVGRWGHVLLRGNILSIETPTVPIIDVSAYVSNRSYTFSES
ncbi:hypothetical protein FRB96_002273 [Tulasnella sp. 330]|nr:hypothetical protein FRB96_002273 [Tulasnella sp. 330]KAG8878049.1 hypothetical protein FRB98_006394 [Tulasnella sp. 332]